MSGDSQLRRRFYVLCRASLDDGVILNLIRHQVYWGPRSPIGSPRLEASRQNHFLIIEARSGEEAIVRADDFISIAGGEAPELRLVGVVPD